MNISNDQNDSDAEESNLIISSPRLKLINLQKLKFLRMKNYQILSHT